MAEIRFVGHYIKGPMAENIILNVPEVLTMHVQVSTTWRLETLQRKGMPARFSLSTPLTLHQA